MITKLILLITLLSYAVVVSQPFMYMLALKNTQLALGGSSYTEVRQLIDANMKAYLPYVMYTTLFANLLLIIINYKVPSGLLFITATIAFIALIVDVLLTLKGNMPLNNLINTWSPANYPSNWQEIRQQWFVIFQYRQVATTLGFISLLVGTIFR